MSNEKNEEWKHFERLVGLIERSLIPGSRVTVNVRLQNLRTKHQEQCDVVIRQGDPPRETVTIVEVQKRGRKVEVNTYRGWITKLEDVGAQHLICVSEEGFPQSVVDDAKIRGNKVRLLTLAELQGNWPINIVDKSIVIVEVALQLRDVHFEMDRPPTTRAADYNTKVIKRGGHPDLLSISELAREIVDAREDMQFLPNGPQLLDTNYIPKVGESLSYVDGDKEETIKYLNIQVLATITRNVIPLTATEYVQTDFQGALAYAFVAVGTFNGQPVHSELIFIPGKDGFMRLKAAQIEGLPSNSVQFGLYMLPDTPPQS